MNTGQLKAISWSLAVVFGAGLAGYVAHYLMNRADLEKRVEAGAIRDHLAKVPPVEKKAEDIVAYEHVNASFYRYNWTAKPPPKPEKVEVKPEGPKGPPKVNTLVKVLLVKADRLDEAQSRAVIKYLPAANVTTKAPTIVKHIGDTLEAPHEGVIVAAIEPEGVRFKFTDAKRPEEFLTPDEFQRRLDMEALVGKEAMPSPTEMHFPRTPTSGAPPERTLLLGEDEYMVGTLDVAEWDQNYQEYLAQIEYSRHRDPTTGKYDGITLTKVPAGSVAASYGAKEGDVIISINGQAVNSTQEAIAYVKNNKDKYDVWEVVILSKGKEKTITYKVPKKK